MTTISDTINGLNGIRDTIVKGSNHTKDEAEAIFKSFDEMVLELNARLAAVRSAIASSYDGQIEADLLLVVATGAPGKAPV